jgi:sialate O-acetylesterase
VAYLFGRELHRRFGVPVGLIDSTWGGTPAETWTSANSLQAFPEFAAAAQREASIPASASKEYESYLKTKSEWYKAHGNDDRGRIDGHDVWAARGFDDSRWPTVIEPQPWSRKAVENFDGTLWMRKVVLVPENHAGDTLHVHLSRLLQADTTYFNGRKIGQTRGESTERDYEVPGEVVLAGRNVVAVRLEGQNQAGDGFVGMHGDAGDMYVDISGTIVSLAGAWSFQSGPDLTGLPKPPPLAEFLTSVPQAPSLLFNGMIAPLTPYRLKGVIWYQGETNVGRAPQYKKLFPALIKDWRAAWGYDMPFLFVQLTGMIGRSPPNRRGRNCAKPRRAHWPCPSREWRPPSMWATRTTCIRRTNRRWRIAWRWPRARWRITNRGWLRVRAINPWRSRMSRFAFGFPTSAAGSGSRRARRICRDSPSRPPWATSYGRWPTSTATASW